MATWLQQKRLKQRKMRRAYLKTRPHGGANFYNRVVGKVGDGKDKYLDFLGLHPKSPERAKVEAFAEKTKQEVGGSRHTCLINAKHFKVVMFFTFGDEERLDHYYFLTVWHTQHKVLRSITYTSRERAMYVFNNGAITWLEKVDLPCTLSVPSAELPAKSNPSGVLAVASTFVTPATKKIVPRSLSRTTSTLK